MTTGTEQPSMMSSRVDGESPEVAISLDLARRGLYVAPVVIAVCGLLWGLEGVYGALYGMGLVLVNFVVAAALMAVSIRISLAVMMGTVLFGLIARMGLILVAVLLVRDASWISTPALGATIIITHLGLLAWELKFVSISLAHSGVKKPRS
jgi:hypothetical protein